MSLLATVLLGDGRSERERESITVSPLAENMQVIIGRLSIGPVRVD